MNRKHLLLTTALIALSASNAAAEWSATFTAPSNASATMLIDLPTDLDIMTLTTLGVELDGVDITAMLAMDNNGDFSYTPVQPLEAGTHTIRLVQLGAETEEKGRWTFDINGGGSVATAASTETTETHAMADSAASEEQIAEAEAWLRGGSVSIDTLTEASNRLFEKDLTNAPDHTIISGAGDVNAKTDGSNWNAEAHANYLVQSDQSLALTGNAVDLGEYDMTANYTGTDVNAGVTLGHHDIGVESNLFSGFYRRGASARVGSADERVQATGFAFSPESISGADNFTGLNESNNRLEGVTASFKPFSNDPNALTVTGLYYDGKGSDGGTGTSVTDNTSTGSGWGVIMEKNFEQQRITLRGEYAHANFDEDGRATTATENASEALSVAIETRPFESITLFDQQGDLVVGARYDRIDTFFASLANEGLAADRSAIQAYTNLYAGPLFAGVQLVLETNNVDDLASAPENRMRSVSMNATYSFDPQTGDLSWLGSPYLNFSGFVSDLDRMETPMGYTGFDTNSMSDSYTFGGGSNYEKWYWNASYTLSQLEDHANAASDTVNNFATISGGWTMTEHINLNSSLSFGSFRDEDNATANYDTNLNLGASAAIIPNILLLNADYNLNLSSGSGDTPNRHIVNSEVEYTLLQPSKNRPGLALALRGSMEDTNGNTNAIQDQTQYQVFTVLRVKTPLYFGF